MTSEQTAVVVTPVILAGLVGEHFLLRATGRPGYSHRRTVNNLGVMIGSRAVLSALGLIPFFGYDWLRRAWGLFEWDPRAFTTWVAGFVLVDLAMFLRHYAAHRVAVLWAIHAVHHQSRDYNLSVALRLSWFQDAVLLGLPLALVGLPLEVVLPLWVAGNLYQYFQHTELVGKLGIVDRLLLTPSNHRVHHGCNPRYIDKNYGSVLLIWDRLLGTFEPETEPVEFGVLSGLPTYDASENSFEPMRQLVAKVRAQARWWDAVRVPFLPPGWVPGEGETVPPLVPDPEPQRQNDPTPTRRTAATALLAAAFAVTLASTWYAHQTPWGARYVAMLATVLSVAIAGVALDNRRVEPVAAEGGLGRVRATVAAWLHTLAGPANGPVKGVALAVEPIDRG